MRLRAIEASAFLILNEADGGQDVKEKLISSGVVPVNDALIDLWENQNRINLLYGSYGSGKSVFIVDVLLNRCLSDKFFRCYYGRKILDTVRGTVFKTLTDRIKELRLEQFFTFSDKPNGTMVIACRSNGNEFIPFGANDSQSLKSIKDPTHFFCEELDQFTFEDFGVIYSRLRTKKAITQFYGAFNTERVYKSHWIRKILFDGEYKELAHKRKVNFTDNLFIDRTEYEQQLRLSAGGNSAFFNAIARGEWGMARTGNEFWKQFAEDRHVKPAPYQPGRTIHVSLDENVNPYVTETIWQINADTKEIRQVHELLCSAPDNNAPKAAKRLAAWLRSIEYKDVVFLYGDPSASRRSTVDENSSSFYDKFASVLKAEGFSTVSRVQRSAPQVALSAAFINEIYENNLGGWQIVINDRCFSSIEDYLLVKEDAEGRMLKLKEKDKESGITYEPAGHISDTKRYFITTVLASEFRQYTGSKRRGSIAA